MKLPSSWALPESITGRFGKHTAGKQRAMYEDGHLLLILDGVPGRNREPGDTVFFWRNPKGEWQYSGRGQGLKQLQEHLEAFDRVEEELKAEYTAADEAEDYFRILETLGAVRETASGLHAALQAAREAVRDNQDIIGFRDIAGELERSFELLYQDTKNALDFSIARKAEEEARSAEKSMRASHRLNILAAIFFPLAAISGIFGMNLDHGLGGGNEVLLFWAIFIAGLTCGLLLRIWILGGSQDHTD